MLRQTRAWIVVGAVILGCSPVAGAATPFGDFSLLDKTAQPFYDWVKDEAVFHTLKIEHVPFQGKCEGVLKSLSEWRPFSDSYKTGPEGFEALDKSWAPWSENDMDAITDCDSFPCKIKTNPKETDRVKVAKPDERKRKIFEIISARAVEYLKSRKRFEYDTPGVPLDPWIWLKQHDYPIGDALAKLKNPQLYSRIYRFTDSGYRPIRQILDLEMLKSGNRIDWFIKDIYTAHYFDGWGEWIRVECDEQKKDLRFVMSLALDFDLFKNKDILSVLGRPKMKEALSQNTEKYQGLQLSELKRKIK